MATAHGPRPPAGHRPGDPRLILPFAGVALLMVLASVAIMAGLIRLTSPRPDAPPTTAPSMTAEGQRATALVPATAAITIISPVHGQRFYAGETVALRGSATDVEGHPLGPEALTWSATLRWPGGDRALVPANTGTSPNITLPLDVDLSAATGGYLDITLRAAAPMGLAAERSVRAELIRAPLTLATNPPGLPLTIDGAQIVTPFRAELWSGWQFELGAPLGVTEDGRLLRFAGWSDGVTQPLRSVRAGDASPGFTAVYATAIVGCARPETRVDEGARQASLRVTLNRPFAEPITVGYGVETMGAAAESDFQLRPGTLTFQPGETSLPITATILEDGVDEPDEGLAVRLEPREGAGLGASGRCELLIADNDLPPQVGFAASAYTVGEGVGATTLEVRLDNPSAFTGLARLRVQGASATAGADFTTPGPELTFAPGQQVATVRIAIRDDQVVEGPERLVLAVEPVEHLRVGEPSLAYLMIEDNDRPPPAPPPTVGFGRSVFSCDEPGGDGRRWGVEDAPEISPLPCEIAIMLEGSARGVSPLTTTVRVAGGDAVAGVDFVLAGEVVTFAPGMTTTRLAVRLLADGLYEHPEEAVLELVPATAGGVLPGGIVTATLKIASHDPRPLLRLEYQEVVEEEAGATVVSAVLSQVSGVDVGLLLGTAGAATAEGQLPPATAGQDFTPTVERLTIKAGETRAQMSVPMLRDQVAEGPELLVVELREVSEAEVAAPASAAITIRDQAPQVRLVTSGSSVREPALSAADQPKVSLSVRLSVAAAWPVSVRYATVDGTAVAGQDFAAASGNLTIAPGQTEATIDVAISGDGLYEGAPPESFQVVLRDPVGATLGEAVATVTIVDHDELPRASFVQDRYSVAENWSEASPREQIIALALSAPAAVPLSVELRVDGTAQPDDYTLGQSTVVFMPGQTEATIVVAILYDTMYDPGETIVLSVADPDLAGSPASCTVEIVDNEIA